MAKSIAWKTKHLKTFSDRHGLEWRATLTKSNDGRTVRAITRAQLRDDGSELEVGGGVVLPNNVADIKKMIGLLTAFLPKDER